MRKPDWLKGRVLILGLGREGQATLRFLRRHWPGLEIAVADQRSWEDKETGGKRSKVEVVVEDFNFVGDGQGGGSGGGSNGGGYSSSSSASSSKKNDEPQIEDINDKPIDLSEIPF